MDIIELIEKGKVKRYLSARKKIIYPGGVYHVMHRAPGRELLFLEESDYLYILRLLKSIAKEFLWEIYSFVFMPNHFHVLLRITDSNLSLGVKKLCEKYAKYFNAKYERKGPVFSRPYRAALCLDDIYLLTVSIYIHLNPFKAGMCEQVDGYRWSSLNLYMGKSRHSFVKNEVVLSIVDEDINEAKKKYSDLLEKSTGMKYGNVIEERFFIESFINKLKNVFKEVKIKRKDILDEKIEVFKDKGRICNPKSIAARKYLVEQLLARGYKIREIADKLEVSRMTIYNIVNFTK